MTRVAVVIPVHNDGPLALEAVASIREREPVEVVVVDDGSTDHATLDALTELEGREDVLVVRQRNRGPGAARMTGVASSSAPYVLPLDADDLLEPRAATAMANALDRHPDAAFCWGDYRLFGDYEGRYRAPRRFLPWSLTWVNVYPVTSLVRRSAIERTGGWADRGYEDWGLWLSFVELGLHGMPIDRVVYRRRMHGAERVLQTERRRHQELYRTLRVRHSAAFLERQVMRSRERPPAWKRVAYPILFGRRAVVPARIENRLQRFAMQRGLRTSG